MAATPAVPVRAASGEQKAATAAPAPIAGALREEAGGMLRRFYASREYKPLWIRNGRISATAERFLSYVETADLDGLKPSSYRPDDLRDAIRESRDGGVEALVRAELMLSDSFSRFVRDQRRPVKVGMVYTDSDLKPKKLKPEMVLRAAALAGPFPDYVADMAWMSPHYVRLRNLLAHVEKAGEEQEGRGQELDRLRLNLDRARGLPGPWTMHVVVDASSARLWYYQGGKQLGTMKVVVGTHETQTPMMAGMLQWAILNPYWNIPDYLVQKNIAPKILSGRTLPSMRIEALSDWSANPEKLPPDSIDWAAVAAGQTNVRLRELPGGANSMGKVKFLFPNDEGIYLHDTPNRALLAKADRHLSNGCIRLENAPALGKWLLRKPITAASKTPEQYAPLPVPVPVYLTYLTAAATEKGVVFRKDIYGRDE
ncbi:MAG: L,D-transpeptidase family protein [Sphingobium sp.]